MNRFSFLITLISLFVAIGISDLLLSLHKLLRIRNEVKWYWVHLIWVLIIFLHIISTWFGIFHYFKLSLANTSAGFVLVLLPVIFLLLCSFAILPDKPRVGIDLKAWYFNQRKYIFSLLLLNFISFGIVKTYQIGFKAWVFISVMVLLIVSLILIKKKWIHIIITLLILIFTVITMIEQKLYLQ